MQTIETKIEKLEKAIAEITRLYEILCANNQETDEFQTTLCEIGNEIVEACESDSDDSDTDSDISFTEEESEYIENEEHRAFLKRYSLKPTRENAFKYADKSL